MNHYRIKVTGSSPKTSYIEVGNDSEEAICKALERFMEEYPTAVIEDIVTETLNAPDTAGTISPN